MNRPPGRWQSEWNAAQLTAAGKPSAATVRLFAFLGHDTTGGEMEPTNDKRTSTTVAYRVDRATYTELRRRAVAEGVTLSDLLRQATRRGLGLEGRDAERGQHAK